MTRYWYERINQPGSVIYKVRAGSRSGVFGECWRASPAYSQATYPPWVARIFTDPTVVGRGRTRDDAVDDVFRQVGGPDA